MQLLSHLDREWNAWKPGALGRLNRQLRDGREVQVPQPLRALIVGARALEWRSGGLFNPAIGGLVGTWGFHDDVLRPGTPPAQHAIEAWTRGRPSLGDLEWRGDRLRSRNPQLQLDFGAYAKGVAADLALDVLARAGVRGAVVNLGGNVAALGHGPGRPWRVGVRDPFGPGWLAQLETRGREAVVTSGTYERWRLLQGRRCSHLIDPRNGQPCEALASVTVVHADAGLADAAATALAVAGPRHWPRVAAALGIDQALVVDAQGRARATPGLWERLRPAPGEGHPAVARG